MQNYKERVEAGASALRAGDDANWELARLTHETTHGQGRPKSGAEVVTLEKWAEDVRNLSGRRFSRKSASVYRRCWEWLEKEQPSAPFPPFTEVYSQVNAESPPPEARAGADGTRVPSAPGRAPTVAPLATITTLPIASATSPPLRLRKDQPGGDPVGDSLERTQALSDLEKALLRIPSSLDPILERLQEGVNLNRLDVLALASGALFLPSALARARATLDAVEVLLTTGRPPKEYRDGAAS